MQLHPMGLRVQGWRGGGGGGGVRFLGLCTDGFKRVMHRIYEG